MLLFVIDAQRQLAKPDPRVVRVIAEYGSGKPPAGIAGTQWHPPPAVLVLNKVDALQRAQRPALLGLAKQLQAITAFKEIFWVSALKGKFRDGRLCGNPGLLLGIVDHNQEICRAMNTRAACRPRSH